MTRIAIAIALILGLSACETTQGFIRDSQNVGDAIS